MAVSTSSSHTLPLKSTAMLVNTFVISTTQFLNHFSTLVEDKLATVSRDVSRLEKVLLLLETKLYRPDAEEEEEAAPAAAPAADVPAPLPVPVDAAPAAADGPSTPAPPSEGTSLPPLPEAGGVKPEHEKYMKMKKMGLPDGAIRQKMLMDGVDSSGFPFDF